MANSRNAVISGIVSVNTFEELKACIAASSKKFSISGVINHFAMISTCLENDEFENFMSASPEKVAILLKAGLETTNEVENG